MNLSKITKTVNINFPLDKPGPKHHSTSGITLYTCVCMPTITIFTSEHMAIVCLMGILILTSERASKLILGDYPDTCACNQLLSDSRHEVTVADGS